MARIGMISSKVRGTPLVFTAANPSGSLVAMAQQGYPIDAGTAYVTDAYEYPCLPYKLPEFIDPPEWLSYEAAEPAQSLVAREED